MEPYHSFCEIIITCLLIDVNRKIHALQIFLFMFSTQTKRNQYFHSIYEIIIPLLVLFVNRKNCEIMKNLTKLYKTVSISFYKNSCQKLINFKFVCKMLNLIFMKITIYKIVEMCYNNLIN